MTFLYMIRNNKDRLYIGISDDPKQRLSEHNRRAGASYTYTGNFQIVLLEEYNTLREARSREMQIKKWRRDKKEMLIERYRNGLSTKVQPKILS